MRDKLLIIQRDQLQVKFNLIPPIASFYIAMLIVVTSRTLGERKYIFIEGEF